MHRPSNVDHKVTLQVILVLLQVVSISLQAVILIHPRTKNKRFWIKPFN